jgi:hypothetical protein
MNSEEKLQLIETAASQLELLKRQVKEWRNNESAPIDEDRELIDRAIELQQTIAETLLITIGSSRKELSELVSEMLKIRNEREYAISKRKSIEQINGIVKKCDDRTVAFFLLAAVKKLKVSLFDEIDIPEARCVSIWKQYQSVLKYEAERDSYYNQFIK